MDAMLPMTSMDDVTPDAPPQLSNPHTSIQQNGVTDSDFDQLMGNLEQPQQDTDKETAKINQIYHQTTMPLAQYAVVNMDDLWQFPNQGLADHELDHHMRHVTGKRFHDACNLVKKHWDIDPSLIVPPQMRAQTPYSLALLVAIRRVASRTKKDFHRGQTALLVAWRNRVGRESNLQIKTSGMQVHQTKVELGLGSEGCEDVIQETDFGLTLDDVSNASTKPYKIKSHAFANVVPAGKLRGKAKKERRVGTTVAPGFATRSMKKAANHQNKAAFGAEIERRQKEPAPLATGSKISKQLVRKQAGKARSKLEGERGYKLLQFLQGDDGGGGDALDRTEDATIDTPTGDVAPPNSPEPNAMPPSRFSDPNMVNTTMRDEQRAKQRANKKNKSLHTSGQDRHNDNLLSQMFNKVDMDSDGVLGAKRKRKMLASASKREGLLPTDRVKLAEIPTLYAQQGPRTGLADGAGMAMGGHKSGFAGAEEGGDATNGLAPGNREGIGLDDDEEL